MAWEALVQAGSTVHVQGPFSTSQLSRISGALDAANAETGLTFSVYMGKLDSPTRERAYELHARLDVPDDSVLIAISPNQRMLEIVTGANARRRISDQSCALVALSMTSSLAGGDLTGAIVVGLHMLSERARW